MRSINCRNTKREIEARGAGRLLSAAVAAHIEQCPACETLSRQQSQLHALVSSLGRVEAPADFDVRLRARLAAERNKETRSFSFANFSPALRASAVAAVLLVIGSAFVFVSFRNQTNPAVAGGNQVVTSPVAPAVAPVQTAVKPDDVKVATVAGTDDSSTQVVSPRTFRRGGARTELASVRGSRLGTRDLSSTSAGVLKRDEQLAGAYPTGAFPINASYQSLKVSVDNGSGLSRTISLPTVSFGSQRSLSNSASPLMASARGTW